MEAKSPSKGIPEPDFTVRVVERFQISDNKESNEVTSETVIIVVQTSELN